MTDEQANKSKKTASKQTNKQVIKQARKQANQQTSQQANQQASKPENNTQKSHLQPSLGAWSTPDTATRPLVSPKTSLLTHRPPQKDLEESFMSFSSRNALKRDFVGSAPRRTTRTNGANAFIVVHVL